jgi:hypothetical protein
MKNKTAPIKPSDVTKIKKKVFPDEVFQAFNELIVQNFSGGSSTVKQDDVVAVMVKKGLKLEAIFDNHWLDVEEIYREAGWKVVYDKPAYCESYAETFTFKQ